MSIRGKSTRGAGAPRPDASAASSIISDLSGAGSGLRPARSEIPPTGRSAQGSQVSTPGILAAESVPAGEEVVETTIDEGSMGAPLVMYGSVEPGLLRERPSGETEGPEGSYINRSPRNKGPEEGSTVVGKTPPLRERLRSRAIVQGRVADATTSMSEYTSAESSEEEGELVRVVSRPGSSHRPDQSGPDGPLVRYVPPPRTRRMSQSDHRSGGKDRERPVVGHVGQTPRHSYQPGDPKLEVAPEVHQLTLRVGRLARPGEGPPGSHTSGHTGVDGAAKRAGDVVYPSGVMTPGFDTQRTQVRSSTHEGRRQVIPTSRTGIRSETHESASAVGREPIPEPSHAEGYGPVITSGERVRQWKRYSDSGSHMSFTAWRLVDENGVVMKRVRCPGQSHPMDNHIHMIGGIPVAIRDQGCTHPDCLPLPPRPTREVPIGFSHPSGDGNTFELSKRGPGITPSGEKLREIPADPRKMAAGDAPESRHEDAVSVASSHVSCTSTKLIKLIQKALQEPNLRTPEELNDKENRENPGRPTLGWSPAKASPIETAEAPVGAAVGSTPAVGTQTAVPVSPTIPVVTGLSSGTRTVSLGKPKKLKGFSGPKTEPWEAYQTHLDIVQKLNGWDDDVTLAHFCAELSSTALQYYSSLAAAEKESLPRVMASMTQRFGTLGSKESARSKLESVHQRTDQTIEDLSQEVRRLAYRAYADSPAEVREAEAVRRFTKAIASKDIVQALINAPEVPTMEKATEMAIRAREMGVAFLGKVRPTQAIRKLEEQVDSEDQSDEAREAVEAEDMMENLRALMGGNRYQRRDRDNEQRTGRAADATIRPPKISCWTCGEEGHLASKCVFKPTNWPDWLVQSIVDKAEGKIPQPAILPISGTGMTAGQPVPVAVQGALPAAAQLAQATAKPAAAVSAVQVLAPVPQVSVSQVETETLALRLASALVETMKKPNPGFEQTNLGGPAPQGQRGQPNQRGRGGQRGRGRGGRGNNNNNGKPRQPQQPQPQNNGAAPDPGVVVEQQRTSPTQSSDTATQPPPQSGNAQRLVPAANHQSAR